MGEMKLMRGPSTGIFSAKILRGTIVKCEQGMQDMLRGLTYQVLNAYAYDCTNCMQHTMPFMHAIGAVT